jgi:hypothetical protein
MVKISYFFYYKATIQRFLKTQSIPDRSSWVFKFTVFLLGEHKREARYKKFFLYLFVYL